MPTYEYECKNGHHFEVVQRMTEDALKRCQVCDAEARRLISAAPFILKGGGWYSDGYSSSNGSGSSSEKSTPSPSSDSSSSGSTKSSSDSSSGSSKGSGGSASSDKS